MLKESVWRFPSTSIFLLSFVACFNFTFVLQKVSDCVKILLVKRCPILSDSTIDAQIQFLTAQGFCSGAVGLFHPFHCLPPLPKLLQVPQIRQQQRRLLRLVSCHIISNSFKILFLSIQGSASLTNIQFQLFLHPVHQELQIRIQQQRKTVSNQ